MNIYEKKFVVSIPDIGENNLLTNDAILRYLQEIAALHSDLCGFGLNQVDSNHLTWILLNWKYKVFSRPKWNTTLLIKTWCRKSEKLYSYRDFEIYDENQNLVAIATSKWLLFNIQKNAIQLITPEIMACYETYDKSVFSTFTEKLKEPESYDTKTSFYFQRRDVDTNHHVNNISYLRMAYEILPAPIYASCDFREIEIMYKKETFLSNECIAAYKQLAPNTHIVTIKSKDEKNLHAIVYLHSFA